MKKLIPFLIIGLFISGCGPGESETASEPGPDFDNALTQKEMDGGRLTPEILWKFSRLGGIQLSEDQSTILFTMTKYDYRTNQSLTNIYSIPVDGGEPRQLSVSGAYHPRWIPGGAGIGYLSSVSGTVQIWEMNQDGSNPTQISDIEGGVNSFEYAPDGSNIMYTKDVQINPTSQEKYPDLPETNVYIVNDLMYRHWNHWEDGAYSHIFVADYTAGKLGDATDIMAGEPFDSPLSPYFDDAEITFSPDGNYIAYTCKKLTGAAYATSTNSDIYYYDIASGNTVNLTEGMPGYEKYPAFSPDGHWVAYQSMATPGYEADKDRLMIQDLNTGQRHDLTASFDQNVSSLNWINNENKIQFISGRQATYQLYEIEVETKEIRQITSGDHNYTEVIPAGDHLYGVKMSMSMASEIFKINATTGEETQLSFVNRFIYDHIEMGQVEKRWIQTTDQKNMLVWVIYPPHFDPQKTYPALLYCQGGPQSAVSQFFSYRWNFQMMAAHDYIIVAPNRRGLPTFGQEWNAQISGDYGGQNMMDYLSAIDALKTEPFIDEERLGAVGASYGGLSVFWLAGNHDKRFKALISHCGIYNFESMYGATEETFFVNYDMGGPYWELDNAIAQRSYATSPHKHVQNWDTPIMIVTGARDYRVPYTQSLEAFNVARLRGIPAKLLFFPEETHFVLKPQNAILWQREFFGWLDTYLK